MHQELAALRPAGLGRAGAGRVRGIEHVDVDRDVNGRCRRPAPGPASTTPDRRPSRSISTALTIANPGSSSSEIVGREQRARGSPRAPSGRGRAGPPPQARRNGVPWVYGAPKYVSHVSRCASKWSERHRSVATLGRRRSGSAIVWSPAESDRRSDALGQELSARRFDLADRLARCRRGCTRCRRRRPPAGRPTERRRGTSDKGVRA